MVRRLKVLDFCSVNRQVVDLYALDLPYKARVTDSCTNSNLNQIQLVFFTHP